MKGSFTFFTHLAFIWLDGKKTKKYLMTFTLKLRTTPETICLVFWDSLKQTGSVLTVSCHNAI